MTCDRLLALPRLRSRSLLMLVVVPAAALYSQAADSARHGVPQIRPLGPILARSTEPLEAVSQVREVSGGRVVVHDNRGRRVALFDSALNYIKPIVDTTASTGRAYGSRMGGLIAARGDTSYFADPASVSLLVIDGAGRIARTIAAPSPSAVTIMVGGPFGTPGTDRMGRLVYRTPIDARPMQRGGSLAAWVQSFPDSSLIVRTDLRSRKIDTIATFRIPRMTGCCVRDPVSGGQTLATFINPIPWTDDWALLADGSVAVVRGQEYRVEIYAPDGSVIRGPKLPFEWEHLSDADKQSIVDSTKAAVKQLRPDLLWSTDPGSTALAKREVPSRDAAGLVVAVLPDYNASPIETRSLLGFVGPGELPDYRPAFGQGAARGDVDGNLWIRTTKNVNGGSVYDVVSNIGELIDRILVPHGRVIVGFGAGGIVYMGVLDGAIARIERARVR